MLEKVWYEFDKDDFENVIQIVVFNPQERKIYTTVQWNTPHGMSARSYKKIGKHNEALKLFEKVYPWIVGSSENPYSQASKLINDALAPNGLISSKCLERYLN
ncbi:MAG: hypothetical protein H0U73_03165 [Tatlockia sp.]|nr:hypothetical protein [Tatlockia sp.]